MPIDQVYQKKKKENLAGKRPFSQGNSRPAHPGSIRQYSQQPTQSGDSIQNLLRITEGENPTSLTFFWGGGDCAPSSCDVYNPSKRSCSMIWLIASGFVDYRPQEGSSTLILFSISTARQQMSFFSPHVPGPFPHKHSNPLIDLSLGEKPKYICQNFP